MSVQQLGACLDQTFGGEFGGEETVSFVFVGETVPTQNCERD